jgi:hypothetical protein
LRTQPLPVLTDAQAKVVGPLQPAGSVPKLPEIPKPDMARPSLEVKVMLIVRLTPTMTDTVPATEGVPTTESVLPVGPLPPPMGLPVGPPPVPPVPPPPGTLMEPLLLPVELDPHPETISSAQAPRRSER